MSDDSNSTILHRMGRNPLYSPSQTGAPTRPVDASDPRDISATADDSVASTDPPPSADK